MDIKLEDLIKKEKNIITDNCTKFTISFNDETNEISLKETENWIVKMLRQIYRCKNKTELFCKIFEETSPITSSIKNQNNSMEETLINNKEKQNNTQKIFSNQKEWKKIQECTNKSLKTPFSWELQKNTLMEYDNLTKQQVRNLLDSGLLTDFEKKYIENKYNINKWEFIYDN